MTDTALGIHTPAPTLGPMPLAFGLVTGAPTLGAPDSDDSPTKLPFLGVLDRDRKVTREYKTEILTSRTGAEQRRALRASARKRVEFDTTLRNATLADFRSFERLMVLAQRQDCWLHESERYVILADVLTAGSKNATLTDTAPDWLTDGQFVLLADGERMEPRAVLSVTGSTVTFTSYGSADFPAGAKVYGGLLGRLDADLKTNVRWLTLLDPSMAFAASPGVNLAEPAGTAAYTFESREVLLDEPNVFDPIQLTHSAARELIDAGQGVLTYFSPDDFTARLWQANYTRLDFDAADSLRQFFDRCLGQCGEFFMPTFVNDLPPSAVASSGSSALHVAGTDIADIYNDHPAYACICAFLADGSHQFNRVSGITKSGSDSVLALANAWSADIGTDAEVSWMPLWRLASDQLEIDWTADRLAKAQLSLRMLHDNTADS